MRNLNAICVYCGSSPGRQPIYIDAAHRLAEQLHKENITLVYGGAHVGVMGAIADRLLELGGRVIGVIPTALVDFEVAHEGLSELIVVKDMHERKAKMAALSDGFIALPGGLGTLEELFEALTWSQLGFHDKPCGLLNIEGFYDQLLSFLDNASAEQFMRKEHRNLLLASDSAEQIIEHMRRFESPGTAKLLEPDE